MRKIDVFHPITMFLYFMCVIIPSMFLMDARLVGISALVAVVYDGIIRKKVPWGDVLFVVITCVLMSIINAITVSDGENILFFINNRAITAESLQYGAISGIMLSGTIIWFRIFSHYMTSEKIIAVFPHMPKTGLVISMTMRFVPDYVKRYRQVSSVNQCNNKSGILKNISAVFSWAIENSTDTADSMAMRGFDGRKKMYNPFKFTVRDVLAVTVILLLQTMYIPGGEIMLIMWCILALMPLAYILKEEIGWKLYSLRK